VSIKPFREGERSRNLDFPSQLRVEVEEIIQAREVSHETSRRKMGRLLSCKSKSKKLF
jgi:hypothetical protein